MRRFSKYLILFGLVAATFLAPALAVPLLTGAVAADAYERSRARRAAEGRASRLDDAVDRASRRRERRREESRSRQAQRSRAVEYSPSKGWDVSQLPLDMHADLSGGEKGAATFTCAGIDGLVTGRAKGRDVSYSFTLDDDTRAEALQRKARMYNGGASVERDGEGRFVVTAASAAAINDLAKAAFPRTEHRMEREVAQVRQYRMDGYASFADALEAFEARRDSLTPVNTFIRVSDRVDGGKADELEGYSYDPVSLPVGSFLINEEELSRFKGTVSLPARTDDVAAAAHDAFDPTEADRVALAEKDRVRLVDGLRRDVTRTFDDELGRPVVLVDTDDAHLASLRPYVLVEGVDALAKVLNDGVLPEGAAVVLDRELPRPGDGLFVLELDRSDDVRSALGVQGEASPAFAARCEAMGITKEQLEASLLRREVDEYGYGSALLRKGLGIDRMKVNGVPVQELAERISNDRLPKLQRKDLESWLNDVSKIQAVSITVDAKKGLMRITSVVDDVTKTETKKLSEKEVRDFANKGKVSKAEMKDLLMQAHPDFFSTYAHAGRALYPDPVKDFLDGRKPRLADDVRKVMAEAKKNTPEKAVRKARRSGLAPSM